MNFTASVLALIYIYAQHRYTSIVHSKLGYCESSVTYMKL